MTLAQLRQHTLGKNVTLMFFSLDGEKDCALLQKPLVITDIATCARLMLLIKYLMEVIKNVITNLAPEYKVKKRAEEEKQM